MNADRKSQRSTCCFPSSLYRSCTLLAMLPRCCGDGAMKLQLKRTCLSRITSRRRSTLDAQMQMQAPSSSGVFSRRDIVLGISLPQAPLPQRNSVREQYEDDAKRLVKEVLKSINTSISSGGSVAKRKRDAQDAKQEIQQFLQKYRNPKSSDIAQAQSYSDIMEALKLLGQFYLQNGASAVLSGDALQRIRGLLQDASDQLDGQHSNS